MSFHVPPICEPFSNKTKSLDLFFRILDNELATNQTVMFASIIHVNGGAHPRNSSSNDEDGSIRVRFSASHIVLLWIVFWARSRELLRHLRRHVGIEESV